MEQEFDAGRRDFVKSMGAGAGAAMFGSGSQIIPDMKLDDDVSHMLVASDPHVGGPGSKNEEFIDFIENTVPSIGPDKLLLNGDILEFWARGMASTCLEYNELLKGIQQLQDSGIDVIITRGNHDYRLIEVGLPDWKPAEVQKPWKMTDKVRFSSGGRDFIALHGDQADLVQIIVMMKILCLTDDRMGKFVWDFYKAFKDFIGGDDDVQKDIGEVNSTKISATGSEWQKVKFSGGYDDPVVFAPAVHMNITSSDHPFSNLIPVHTRIREVKDGSFEIKLEEWGTSNANPQKANFVVFNEGTRILPGDTRISVGTVKTDQDWKSVSLNMDNEPAVLTQTQTYNTNRIIGNKSDPVVTRVKNVSEDGFDVRVEEEDPSGNHSTENIGYLAIEQGKGETNGNKWEAGKKQDVGDFLSHVKFDQDFSAVPLFLGGVDSYNSPETVELRYTKASEDGVRVYLEPAISDSDTELESISYLAFQNPGEIDAVQRSFDVKAPTSVNTMADARAQANKQLPEKLKKGWAKRVDSYSKQFAEKNTNMDKELQAVSQTQGLQSPGKLGGPYDIFWETLKHYPPLIAGMKMFEEFIVDNLRQRLLSWYDRYVVYGHTHQVGIGDGWVNSGAWTMRGISPSTKGPNTYVDIQDGNVDVYQWYQNKQDEKIMSDSG
ncbi:MAG: metallophosphoesterase [Halobacteria archaeon]